MTSGGPIWSSSPGPVKVMDRTTFPSWTTRAACIDLTHRFFVDDVAEKDGRLTITAPIKKAKSICAGCPVRRECLSYAFEMEDRIKAMHDDEAQAQGRKPAAKGFRSGIFGGITGQEREQQAQNPNRITDLLRIFEAQVFTYRLGERVNFVEEETA